LLPNFEHKFSNQVGYVAWVSGQGVIDKFLSFILLLVVSEQVRRLSLLFFVQVLPFCVFMLPGSSVLVW
jgi:hypothetical protein